MYDSERIPEVKRRYYFVERRISKIGIAFILIGLTALVLFFFPSAHERKQKQEIADLDKSYELAKQPDIDQLLTGHFISNGTRPQAIKKNEAAFIMIWAPFPTSPHQGNVLAEFGSPTQINRGRDYATKYLLIAPHEQCPGLILLGRYQLARYYNHDMPGDFFNLNGEMLANPEKATKKIQKLYDQLPKSVRSRAEKDIEDNQRMLEKYRRYGTVLQTGIGPYFYYHSPLMTRNDFSDRTSLPFKSPP